MAIASLKEVLDPALTEGYAVAGLVVLGWEDVRAFVEAAELEQASIILQVGPACRAYTPLPLLAKMLLTLAEPSPIPVVVHLDHSTSVEECHQAIDLGFTSVMFDGSRLPLADNIRVTTQVVKLAHAAKVSVEGEVGFVGYSSGEKSTLTNPLEAGRFETETGVDATAVSVGNVHLQQNHEAEINLDQLRAIEAETIGPLVIHGTSGIPKAVRVKLARETRICKFNVGTELRMVFGEALRNALASDRDQFDRLKIMGRTISPLCNATRAVIRELRPSRE